MVLDIVTNDHNVNDYLILLVIEIDDDDDGGDDNVVVDHHAKSCVVDYHARNYIVDDNVYVVDIDLNYYLDNDADPVNANDHHGMIFKKHDTKFILCYFNSFFIPMFFLSSMRI